MHAGGATAAIVGANLAVVTAGWAGLPDDSRVTRATGYGLGVPGLLSGALLVATDLPTGACERGAIYPILPPWLASTRGGHSRRPAKAAEKAERRSVFGRQLRLGAS